MTAEFKFRFTGDLRDLQKQLKELGRDLGDTKKQGAEVAKGIGSGAGEIRNVLSDIRSSLQSLQREFAQANAATREARRADAAAAAESAQRLATIRTRQREITAEIERRAKVESAASARALSEARALAAEQSRIAAKRADAIAAFSSATPEQLRTPQERTSAIGREQALRRDADLRMLDINRRADALEARLAATRTRGAAAARSAATATAQQAKATQDLNRQLALAAPQLTDIVTSLASGQSPFLVAIQQGGQLRDVFGGLRPAFAGLGRAVLSLVNPLTLTIAALAVVGVGFAKGQEESLRFARTVELTGGAAGITAGQLNDMAASLDNLDGSTRSSAADTLNAIAESGKFTADQFGLVARASEQMRNATGRDIQATIDEFAKIADDPVAALDMLSAKYNIVDGDIRRQITLLQEQGREQEAVTLLIRRYSGAINERTPGITENLGYIERGWRAIENAARKAGDFIMDIGRTPAASELRARQQQLQRIVDSPGGGDSMAASRARAQARRQLEVVSAQLKEFDAAEAKAQAESARSRAKRTADQLTSELQTEAKQYESKEKRRANARIAAINRANQAIANARTAGDKAQEDLAAAARDKIIAGLDKEAAEEAAREKKAGDRAESAAKRKAEQAARAQQEATRRAANLVRVDADLVRDAVDRALRELDRLYSEGLISAQDYYRQKADLETQAIDAAIKAAEAERDAAVEIDERKRSEADILRLQRDRAEIGPRAAREQAAAERELNAELQRLQARLAEANGAIGEQGRVQLEQERDALLRRFQNNPGAQQLVRDLFDAELARSRADAIGNEADRLLSRLSDRSQLLSSQAQVGAITQIEAERQVRAERQQTIQQLEELLQKAQAALSATPSPEALAAVDQLKIKINELKAAEETLAQTAQQAGFDALRQLFTDLATGAKSFEDAIKSAVLSFVQGMAMMAAEALAKRAIGGITSAFGGGQDATKDPAQAVAAGTAYAAPVTAAAAALGAAGTTSAAAWQAAGLAVPAALTPATAALGSAGATVTSGAIALQLAAVQLQAAATTLLAANSVSSVGVAHSGARVGRGFPAYRNVPSHIFAAAPRFHTGSGVPIGLKTNEVPAVLQTGERVLNRRETAQYEASQRGGGSTRVVNAFDPAFVPDQMDSADGERVILNVIGRNPGRIKQLLG